MNLVTPLRSLTNGDMIEAGPKAANLSKMLSHGAPVPPGIVIMSRAYLLFLEEAGLRGNIGSLLKNLDFANEKDLLVCSSRIGDLIAASKMDPQLSDMIISAISKMEPKGVWAVRSSAVAEDLPDSSFAGQQDSYLCVRTELVPEHVKRCWASYWSARAMKYRHDLGIDHLATGIAVIVQKMVDATSSGVLFTSDPMGRDPNAIVLESSWGLGESTASGTVTPDRFVLDRSSLRIISMTLGRKRVGIYLGPEGKISRPISEADQKAPSLKESEAVALAALGKTIEERLGSPQDIEWALEGGKFYVLQSRPITTLAKTDETLWTRAYGDEYWADVTSPLFFSLLGEYLSKYVNKEGSKILGYKGILDEDLLRVHKCHIYFNTAVLEEVFTYNPRFSRTKELLNYFPEKDQDRIARARTRLLSRLWSEVRVLFMDPDGMIFRTDRAYKQWASSFLKEMSRFDTLDLTRLKDEELHREFRLMEAAYLKHYRLIRYGMVSHSIGTNLILKKLLNDWLDDKSGALYSKLVSGLPDNKTIQTNMAAARLAARAQTNHSVAEKIRSQSSKEIVTQMSADPEFADFKATFDEFIKDYGHRSHTREIFFPRWADDRALVVDIVKALLSSKPLDLDELERRKIEERLRTQVEVLERISKLSNGRLKKMLFKMLMGYAQTYLMFRENQRFYLDHQIFRQRKLFVEYGRRMVRNDSFDHVDDVFFLSKEEVFESINGARSVPKAEVARRRAEFEKYTNVLPPKFLRGDIEFDDTMAREGGGLRVTGTSSSPGIATGTLRVVKSIEHLSEVRENEILVTSNTDPGWTAVFSKLGGLITETGGILSHGAVVSREYGIPAVTAVKNATGIFRTGQRATIDGNEGVIYIEEGGETTDIIHPFGSQPDWSESFYFSLYDRENDICAFMRIGLKPNRDEKNMFCYLMMAGERILGIRSLERFENSDLKVGPLHFHNLAPERKWALDFRGSIPVLTKGRSQSAKVTFDLEFEGINKLFDYRECVSGVSEAISRKVASEHLEQFGRISGSLTVGGSKYNINGLGERDHSWGVRDWTAPKMWIWLNCQFSEEHAFNLTRLVVDQGVVEAGFVYNKGKNSPVVKSDIDTKYDSDGSPSSISLRLHCRDGSVHDFSAEIIRRTILPFSESEGKAVSTMHETLARYSSNNEVGYGIAEYLIRENR